MESIAGHNNARSTLDPRKPRFPFSAAESISTPGGSAEIEPYAAKRGFPFDLDRTLCCRNRIIVRPPGGGRSVDLEFFCPGIDCRSAEYSDPSPTGRRPRGVGPGSSRADRWLTARAGRQHAHTLATRRTQQEKRYCCCPEPQGRPRPPAAGGMLRRPRRNGRPTDFTRENSSEYPVSHPLARASRARQSSEPQHQRISYRESHWSKYVFPI